MQNKNKIITIFWDSYEPEPHKIEVRGNGYQGYCLTHKEEVTQSSRCSHFPCQSAMWFDMWKSQLGISSQQR